MLDLATVKNFLRCEHDEDDELIQMYIESAEDYVKSACGDNVDLEVESLTTKDRMTYALDQVKDTYKKVFWYIVIGVGIGSLIHNWIPGEWIENVLGKDNPFSVILAVLVGAPSYAEIFGTIPIAEALYNKGAGLGTILAFMMSVTTLSIPSLIMLKMWCH